MIKNGKNIRGWIILIGSGIAVFIIMPYAFWTSNREIENLEKRGKHTTCKVIGISGLKGNNIRVEYFIDNERFEKVKTAPSGHNVHVDDKLKMTYDPLNHENFLINW